MKFIILMLGAPLASLHARPQVNSEIFTDEDLLAIDSDTGGQRAVVAAPPGFYAGGGGNSIGLAAPPRNKQPPQPTGGTGLLSYRNQLNQDGSYEFGYTTDDGQSREEAGQVTAAGYSVTGRWSFVGTDGIVRTVEFTADENGFQPRVIKGGTRVARQSRNSALHRKESNFRTRNPPAVRRVRGKKRRNQRKKTFFRYR